MRDGTYALRFSADGYLGNGCFTMHDNRGEAHEGRLRIDGHLIERPATLDAIFNVSMDPEMIGNSGMPSRYSVQMNGAASDDGFSVIGVGPLGLIVEISGEWSAPLDERPHRA